MEAMDRLDRSLLREHSTTSARVQAYAALRAAIISGELQPGRQLSENELAARLGVSRTPIREALVRLRDERLVEIVPQLGTFVTRISGQGHAFGIPRQIVVLGQPAGRFTDQESFAAAIFFLRDPFIKERR